MAISLVQQLFGQENNVAAFQTNTLVTPTTVGNTLITVVTCFKTGAADPAIAMSDSKTNTWSVASAVRSTTGGGRVYIFSAPITASQASHQVTATANATAFISLSVWEFSGLTASPIGQSTGTTGSSTAGASGNITTTTKNNLYIGAGTVDTAAITFTAGNAFLKKDQVTTGQDLYSEYKIDRAITTGALFTWSSTTAWAVSVASFNAADDSPAPQWVMSNSRTGPQALRNSFKSQTTPWFYASGPTVYNSSLSGGLSFIGDNTKQTNYPLSGTLSFIGAIAKKLTLSVMSFAGSLSFVGTFSKQTNKGLTGTLSFIGAISRTVTYLLAGTLSFIGAITKSTIRTAMTANLSFIGSFTKSTTRPLTGTLSFIGTFNRTVRKLLSGTLSFIGSINRTISHGLSGTLNFIGAMTKSTSRALSASLSFIGNLVGNLVHGGTVYNQALTATLSFSGTMVKSTGRSFTGTLSFVGAISRQVSKTLAGTLSFSGSIIRRIAKGLSSSLSFVGNFTALKSGAVGTKSPFFILLTDGRTAIRLGNNLYMPL